MINALARMHGYIHTHIAQPRFLPHFLIVHATIGIRVDLRNADSAVIHFSMESRGNGRLYIAANLLGIAAGRSENMNLRNLALFILAHIGRKYSGNL